MITAGVDLGLTSVKAVILKDGMRVGYSIAPTGSNLDLTAKHVLEKALKMAALKREDIDFIVSTGYGRRVTSLTNETISEISANARGVQWLGASLGVRTIIDIGGQDSKVIALDDNLQIHNFAMNDKYDAGIGRYLEVLAKVLDVSLEQMGELALKAKNPVDIKNTSIVFAKLEVSNLVFQGYKKEDIIAGIYRAVARRLVAMAKKVGIRGTVLFDGGPAKNIGMVKAMERELGKKMYVPKNPQMVAATGATLIAAERFMGNGNGNGSKLKNQVN